ncbi:hypothetical protein CYMTET_11779 [Cymbomonas tetramitiformis]|uniref:Uncharacterized protein n=1 Tax=Cymbomonas tetramitiformis TaxID=36881 RepID=A0AAE0GM04_9CHLO|nr:hypothetical protein CYMTET_11779 [Cymbomonas tetramitiformis]
MERSLDAESAGLGLGRLGWAAQGSSTSHNKAAEGAGLYAGAHAAVTVEAASAVEHNMAMGSGGGVSAVSHAQLLVRSSAVNSNVAGASGGGINIVGTNLTVTIDNSTLSANIAESEGGGLHALHALSGIQHGQVVVQIEGGSVVNKNRVERYSGGGIALLGGAHLHLTGGSVVAGNVAVIHGGGLFAELATVFASDCNLANNTAEFEGGNVYATRSSHVSFTRCTLQGGHAGATGGALSVSYLSTASVVSSVLEGNSAAIKGGGMCVTSGSQLRVAASELAGQEAAQGQGGAMFLSEAIANISATYVWGSFAGLGGGAIAGLNSTLLMQGCRLSVNVAINDGGGVLLSAGMRARLLNTSCEGNVAGSGDGGAVATEGAVLKLELRDMAFSGNSAQHGTVYIDVPSALSEPPVLEQLHFANYTGGGGQVFSLYEPDAAMPECVNCTFPAGTRLHATTPARYVLVQEGRVVAESAPAASGNATASTAIITGESWKVLTPAISYQARDYYGFVCSPESTAGIFAKLDPAETTGEYVVFTGGTSEVYTHNDGGIFESLVLVGTPGARYMVQFEPGVTGWLAVPVTLALVPCQAGDCYDAVSQQCDRCQDGYLKFSADETQCAPCDGRGVTCPGGNAYVLEDGYWLANGAIRAGCAKNDTECVLEKVQRCDWAEACEITGAHRGNVAGSLTVPTSVLCADAYDPSVVLCGGCAMGYEMMPTRVCARCPPKWWAWLRLLAAVLASPLLMLLMLRSITAIEAQNPTVSSMCARQVMSQQLAVFGVATIPQEFQSFLHMPSLMSFDLLYLCGMSCILYHTTTAAAEEYNEFGHFYASFALYASLPVVLSAPIVLFAVGDLLAVAKMGTHSSVLSYLSARLGSFGLEMPTRLLGAHFSSFSASVSDIRRSITGIGRNIPGIRLAGSRLHRTSTMHRHSTPGRLEHPYEGMEAGSPSLMRTWTDRYAGGSMYVPSVSVSEGGVKEIVNPVFSTLASHDSFGSSSSVELLRALHTAKSFREEAEIANADQGGSTADNCETLRKVHILSQIRDQTGDSPGWGPRSWQAGSARSSCATSDSLGTGEVSSDEEDVAEVDGDDIPLDLSLPEQAARKQTIDQHQTPRLMTRPSVAMAIFLMMFLHPTVSTSMFQVFNCDFLYHENADKEHFLHLDRLHKCFTLEWWGYASVSLFIIAVYVIGLPAGFCALCHNLYMKKKVVTEGGQTCYVSAKKLHIIKSKKARGSAFFLQRHNFELETEGGERICVFPVFIQGVHHSDPIANIESKILHPKVQSILGPYVDPFKDTHYYWMFYEIIRRLMATSVVILVQMMHRSDENSADLLYSMVLSTVSLGLHCYVRPYKSATVNFFQMADRLDGGDGTPGSTMPLVA